MSNRLPNLASLRVFEAAARHLSFTRAAAELNVTQSAVSHQIRALEDELGIPLFRRTQKGLRLTEAAQDYAPALKDAFSRIRQATERVRGTDATGPLSISVSPSFAARWLAGRLTRFHERHPEIELKISATNRMVDFEREEIDLALRHGGGSWPGVAATLLVKDELILVASPRLGPLETYEDISRHTLLRDDFVPGWAEWCAAAGIAEIDARRATRFDDSNVLIEAVIRGVGIGLSRRHLVDHALSEGLLVCPFAIAVLADTGHYVVAPERSWDRPKIRAFRDWALSERDRDVRPAPRFLAHVP